MVLIETMGAAWTQYRQGMVYAIQHKQYDSGIAFLHGMWSMLPEKDRTWFWHDLGVNPMALVDFFNKTKEQQIELKQIVEDEIKSKTPHKNLPPVPVAVDLVADAKGETMKQKVLWINRGIIIIENAISKWIHHNIDRASYS
jgi:hypothetical protein